MKIIRFIMEKIKNNYMLFFSVYFITIFLDITTLKIDYPIIEMICKIIRYVTYIMFTLRLVLVFPDIRKNMKKIKMNDKKIAIIVLLVVLLISIIGNCIVTGDRRLLFLALVLISSYSTNCDNIIKNMMRMQMLLTIVIVMLSVFGATQNYIVFRGAKNRYSLGFSYTTNLAQLIMFSTILFMYIRKFRIDFIHIAYIQLLNLFVYFITDSRSEFIFLELVIILSALYNLGWLNKFSKIKKSISYVFSYIFPFFPIISFAIVCMYPIGGIFIKINKLLSNRLLQTFEVLKQYGISLFGKSIEFVGNGIAEKIKYGPNIKSNFVDNEYMQLLFTHGLIFIIVFVILLSIMLINLNKKCEYKKLFICFIYLTFGLLNPRILNLVYSPMLFILMYEIISILNRDNREQEFNNEKFNN